MILRELPVQAWLLQEEQENSRKSAENYPRNSEWIWSTNILEGGYGEYEYEEYAWKEGILRFAQVDVLSVDKGPCFNCR
jgi:hypothetical protein